METKTLTERALEIANRQVEAVRRSVVQANSGTCAVRKAETFRSLEFAFARRLALANRIAARTGDDVVTIIRNAGGVV